MPPPLTPPTARQVSPACWVSPQICAHEGDCTIARIRMGVNESTVSVGKKRLSTATWTCCVEYVVGADARLASNASQTPAHFERQREVEPHAWK